MESGIIKLAPVFKGDSTTTAEEMKEYMQGVVTRFCEITGLVVIETVDHDRGAFFIIGEEGKTQGLIAIGNSRSVSYYNNTMLTSNIGPDNEIRISFDANINANAGDGQAFAFNQRPVYMSYYKVDHSIAIGLQISESPSKPPFVMALQGIINGSGTEELIMLRSYGDALYASYNPLLLNEGKSTALFTLSGFNKNIIPQDKEAVADIYLESGEGLPGLKLYTNKKNTSAWNRVDIGGMRYLVVKKGSGGCFSLIMKSSDTEAQV